MNNTKDIIKNELDSYANSQSIFTDEAILTFDFLPNTLPHRDNQILELTRYFRSVFNQNEKSLFLRQTIILLGPLGTGKTSTAKRFGNDLEKISELKIQLFHLVYRHFNCRTHRSINILLVDILKSILPYYPKRGFSASELIRDLFNTLEKRNLYLVLTLDEIDYLFNDNEISNLLYSFTRTNDNSNKYFSQRISLILITKNKEFLFLLDPSIKSSLAKNIIHFPSYTENEIKDILKERTKISLIEGAVLDQILDSISEIAAEKGGDARLAIELLWRTAKMAESSQKLVIHPNHLRQAITSINPINKQILDDLTFNELLSLYSLARTCQRNLFQYKIELPLVKSQYILECEKLETPINESKMNIWPYIKKLHQYGLINLYVNNMTYNSFTKSAPDLKPEKTEISLDLPLESLLLELESRLHKTANFNSD
ncbi:MAG: Cdc6/Cdc18 family protein [Candidatus Hodarchaeales archaeon]|jgi:cell division control protein 6